MTRRTNRRQFLQQTSLAGAGFLAAGTHLASMSEGQAKAEPAGKKVFQVGAHAIDITPTKLPVIVNGYTLERSTSHVDDPLYARCVVLDDGTTRIAIVVVDICVMPRDLIDRAKELARQATGISTDRMLIAATHTHSAPSVMPALGSGADPNYVEFLPGQLAKGIELAAAKLAPARVGWTVAPNVPHTQSRRWIMRSDWAGVDPFGRRERAKMCPGYEDPMAVGPAGPVDRDLSVIAFQSPDGKPMALVANYSNHYYHATPLSAGYYGRFVKNIESRIESDDTERPFVAIMSQGTSGDQMYMDYSRPKIERDVDAYSEAVAKVAYEAYRKIEYHDWVPLAMGGTELTLGVRLPDEKRLAWAKQVMAELGDRPPRSRPEIFAREQIYLTEKPTRRLKLQAIRIGELGVAAIPCEVYGITGLKLKAQSPLATTVNFSLANGEEGYIPPPEQHPLGGYSTWEARTAGLEEEAEPKIVETVLGLLEEVAGKPRRKIVQPQGAYTKAVLASKPMAYWPMGEFAGPAAVDATGNRHHGTYEPMVAFYLEGPQSPGFCGEGQIHRTAHFTGGRMRAVLEELGGTYSVEMWLFGGMPADARPIAGYFFSRGDEGADRVAGDHLGIGGTTGHAGRLIFFNGHQHEQTLGGKSELALKTWYHVVLVRDGKNVSVYLNGKTEPEISGSAEIGYAPGSGQLYIGGRSDNFANFEGKISDVAVFDRTLAPDEVAKHFAAAAYPTA